MRARASLTQRQFPHTLECGAPSNPGAIGGTYAGQTKSGGYWVARFRACEEIAKGQPLYESSPRKQGPILRGLSIGCGVWVQAP